MTRFMSCAIPRVYSPNWNLPSQASVRLSAKTQWRCKT